MNAYTPTVPTLCGVVFGASLLVAAPLAHAQPDPEGDPALRRSAPGLQMSVAIEPGLAIALTDPQSQRTDAGFGQTLKLLFGVGRYLELGPTAAFTALLTSSTMPTSGTSWAFGGGARVMRPHDAPGGAAGHLARVVRKREVVAFTDYVAAPTASATALWWVFDPLNRENNHAKAVAENPADWMPWNYRATGAHLPRHGPIPGPEPRAPGILDFSPAGRATRSAASAASAPS
jgi:hypothetical protein